MHCFLKSLIVIRRYHHFTHRAANHCCQSLKESLHIICMTIIFFEINQLYSLLYRLMITEEKKI